jgi:hypothetical protein
MVNNETCKENTGFLTLRRCDKPAVAACSLCKKPVCGEHGPALASGQIACLTCTKQQAEMTPQQQQAQAAARQGQSGDRGNYGPSYYPYYDSYYFSDYHPYSVHDRFDEKDYSAFNAEAPDSGRPGEGFEGS